MLEGKGGIKIQGVRAVLDLTNDELLQFFGDMMTYINEFWTQDLWFIYLFY